MPLRADFKNILEIFIFTNLPQLTNPAIAQNAVFSDAIIPTSPTSPTSPLVPLASQTILTTITATNETTRTTTTTTDTATAPNSSIPLIIITPQILLALQAAALNNFTDLGLRPDLEDIARIFFANLPPVIRSTITTTTT